MNFRTILFWTHLACGVLAGLVVLAMSVTGVLLTYERQLVRWADLSGLPRIEARGPRLPADALLAAAVAHAPGEAALALRLEREEHAPATVSLGRERLVYVDPYTAAVIGEGAQGVRAFFRAVTALHRWFNAGEESRAFARAVTGAANLVFAFLILSGTWLWLPRIWRWSQLRMRLLFRRSYRDGHARDWNWHHVCGGWMALPLLLVVLSATVFSYSWANALVFRAFGEEAPQRRGPPGGDPQVATPSGLDALFRQGGMSEPGWRSLTLRLPPAADGTVSLVVDTGDGGQPQRQATLTLDPATGEALRREAFSDLSPGRQARSVLRRLHTGEVLGVAGQTVAGLASLAAVLLVWSGLALAWRRLVRPLLARPRG